MNPESDAQQIHTNHTEVPLSLNKLRPWLDDHGYPADDRYRREVHKHLVLIAMRESQSQAQWHASER